jgi:hypothetical protein
MPMKAIVTLGDGGSAQAGLCGESDFTLEDCEADEDSSVRCDMR